jgi:hypothetical protein
MRDGGEVEVLRDIEVEEDFDQVGALLRYYSYQTSKLRLFLKLKGKALNLPFF